MWTINIQKMDADDKFGVVWSTKKEREGYPITAVREGKLISRFNEEQPECAVQVGDFLVTMNGSTDEEEMKKHCAEETEFEVVLRRKRA
mmetsp:Transcript_73767/g.169117  ORF Transcript_73767/g.169117 Transcript_73767/m.169117 type:complete len:89 (-) Transcript_73767:409-675(-)